MYTIRKSTYLMKIDICHNVESGIHFVEKQRLHQNWYFHNVKQVYICWYQRTSSKLIFWSHETGIQFLEKHTSSKSRFVSLETGIHFWKNNVLHQNRYFYNRETCIHFWKFNVLLQIRYFDKLKQKFQVFLYKQVFWKSTYFMKIDIRITWIRYTFLEKQRLHQTWNFYNLNQVYISG